MQTWIMLFRAINVGGNNILKMAELRTDLTELGFQNVSTYIQSGNVVFQSRLRSVKSIRKKVVEAVERRHGFRPDLCVFSHETLARAIQENPFAEATADPKSLHFFFFTEPIKQYDLAQLDKFRVDSENFYLGKSAFYLHAPEGLSKSKLAPKVEKLLGISATARNYRTVAKLAEMVP